MSKRILSSLLVIPGVKPGIHNRMTKRQFQKGFLKLTKKALTTYLIVSTVIVGTGLIYLFNPFTTKTAEAAWFNDDWGYRQEVPVTANTGADTNSYISFTLDTTTLINNNKLQSSCQDIRITDFGGNILQYHIGRTNACNLSNTTIDALVPTLAAGPSTFYVYYGNPSVSSQDVGAFSQSEAVSYTIGTLGSEAKGTSPVAYWKFNEGQGQTLNDSSSSGASFDRNTVINSAGDTGTFSTTSQAQFSTKDSYQNITTSTLGSSTYVYALGGCSPDRFCSSTTVVSTVYKSTINTTSGDLGTFSTTSQNQFTQLSHDSASFNSTFGSSTYVYVIGGENNSGLFSTIYKSTINSTTGDLDPFSTTSQSQLEKTRSEHNAVTQTIGSSTYVYVLGGFNASTIYKSTFNSTSGDLGAFATTSQSQLEKPLWEQNTITSTFGSSTYMYVFGGSISGVANSSTVYKSTLNSTSGDLGAFATTSQSQLVDLIDSHVSSSSTFGSSTYLYILGGFNGAGLAASTTYKSTFNSTSGDLGAFATTSQDQIKNLTTSHQTFASTFGSSTYMYVLGGSNTTTGLSTVYKSSLSYSTSATHNATLGATSTSASDDPTWVAEDLCISGKCLQFDGTTDFVNSPENPLLTPSAMAVSVWIKPNALPASGASAVIVDKRDNNGSAGYSLDLFNSGGTQQIRWQVAGSSLTANNTLPTNTWSHIEVSQTGTTATIYLNGVSIGSGTVSSLLNYFQSLRIGSKLGGSYFQGFIDEAKIYPNSRSADQVKADYSARSNPEGASVILGSSTPPGSVLSNGLVGYWKADEGSGNMADSSGNGTTLTDTNTVAFVAGKFGNGGDFELDNTEYQSAADNASLSVTGSLTLAAWIKPETVTAGSYNILGKWDGATESYRLFQNGDEIRLEIDSAGNYQETSSSNLAAGTFYHIVGVYNAVSSTIKIYINGSEATSTTTGTIPSSIGDDTGKFHIGAEDSTGGATGYYDGIIDEARVYNRALSNTEVSQLYNFAPSPVGYWKMEQGAANTCSVASADSCDSSGNSNDITWNGNLTSTHGGKYGKGLIFDGSGDYGTSANNTINPSAVDFSVSLWFNPTTISSTPAFISQSDVSGTGRIWLEINSDNNKLETFLGGSANTANTAVSTGSWYHAALTKSGTTVKIYLNGRLDATFTITSEATSGINYIGSNKTGSAQFFNGKIDDLRIYNYARSAKQIIEDMNAGHPAPGSPVSSALGHWKFEEGAANRCSGGTNDACNSGSLGSVVDGAFSATTPTYTNSGKFGKALTFTRASSTDISISNESNFDFERTDQFSISAWVKPNITRSGASTQHMIVSKRDNASPNSGWEFDLKWDGTSKTILVFQLINTTGSNILTVQGTSDIPNSSWTFVTVTYDGSSSTNGVDFYINGQPESFTSDENTLTASILNNITPRIGSRAGAGHFFNGDIDEVKIYSGALTADQVKQDFNRSSSQVLGALGDNTTYEKNAANQEYCVPGDSTSCASPVGRWDLEEKVGNTSFDTSTTGNDLTWTNTPTSTRGKIGTAINLAGSNQHLIRADDADFDFAGGGSFTLEAYFKHSASPGTQEEIMSKFATQGYKLLMETDGDITCTITDDAAQTDSATSTLATYDDNLWHHAACVKNASTSLTLYIDGVQVNQDATIGATSTLANTDPLYVGIDEDATSEDWVGQLDQVRIFNYARSASQVAWDYNRGGPIGYWKMDECQGITINDSSGNSNTGTLNLGASPAAGTCSTSSTAWGNGVIGKKNYSLDFDGTDDNISVGDVIEPNTITLAAWAKTDDASTHQRIISKWGDTAAERQYTLATENTNKFRFAVLAGGSGDICDSSITYNTGSWYHVLGTYNGTTCKIYVNGLDVTSVLQDPGSGDIQNTSTTLRIGIEGDDGTSFPFDGQIDDVKIFNYSLTPVQVKLLYNNGAVNFSPVSGAP